MAKPLSKTDLAELREEELEHLAVRVGSNTYCSEDLNQCRGCNSFVVEPLDDMCLCGECAYDHVAEMEHIQDLMRRYRKDAL